MATRIRTPKRATAASRAKAQEYLERADGKSVESAEHCVRQHPESAVWTAFACGLLLGAAAGWIAAQQEEDHWYDGIDDVFDRLRRRLHL
jgi:ribosome-associated translation inhibitor RaiA